MTFLDALHTYFRAEKGLAWFLVGLGLCLLAAGLFVWRTQTGSFMWGLLVPLVVIGLVGVGGGIGFAIQTDKQVKGLTETYRSNPSAFVAQEAPRMMRVNANWPRLKAAWAIMATLSLAVLFVVGREWATGVALVLLFMSSVLFAIDVFAERRATVYAAEIAKLAP